jgi:hypothetical protein
VISTLRKEPALYQVGHNKQEHEVKERSIKSVHRLPERMKLLNVTVDEGVVAAFSNDDDEETLVEWALIAKVLSRSALHINTIRNGRRAEDGPPGRILGWAGSRFGSQ